MKTDRPNGGVDRPRAHDTTPPRGSDIGGVTLSCGFCGHRASLDEFCETPVSGRLPRNVFQCPACHRAVKKTYGPPTVYPSGFVMPGPVTMEEVGAVL